MNPIALERCIVAALTASAFPTTTIYCGTSYEEISPENLNLIVSVNQVSTAGQGIYSASITISIVVPALLGASSYTAFSDTLESLKTGTTTEYLQEYWPSATSPSIPIIIPFIGVSPSSSISTTQSGNSWQADLQISIGIGN